MKREIEINEDALKNFKNLFFWFMTEPVQREGYLDGYTSGVIATMKLLGVWDLFQKNENAHDLPMNVRQRVKEEKGLI